MAYSTSIPPQLVIPSIGNKPALWMYTSVDPSTTVDDSGYFTNGSDLGMKVSDIVLSVVASSYNISLGAVSAVTASSAATVIFGGLVST